MHDMGPKCVGIIHLFGVKDDASGQRANKEEKEALLYCLPCNYVHRYIMRSGCLEHEQTLHLTYIKFLISIHSDFICA
jgi:hypothetical protein